MSEETQAGPIPAELLRLVKRSVDKKGGGTEERPIARKDVLDWKSDGRRLVVVTVDGAKYRATIPAPQPPRTRASGSAASVSGDGAAGA